jgi:hypothetical protein
MDCFTCLLREEAEDTKVHTKKKEKGFKDLKMNSRSEKKQKQSKSASSSCTQTSLKLEFNEEIMAKTLPPSPGDFMFCTRYPTEKEKKRKQLFPMKWWKALTSRAACLPPEVVHREFLEKLTIIENTFVLREGFTI